MSIKRRYLNTYGISTLNNFNTFKMKSSGFFLRLIVLHRQKLKKNQTNKTNTKPKPSVTIFCLNCVRLVIAELLQSYVL